MISLRLFGQFQLIDQGREVVLGQPRLEELVALLSIQSSNSISRLQIAHHLWPDSSEKQARANVRNLLHKLRQVWPEMDDAITVSRTHVVWQGENDINIDVQRFKAVIADADQHQGPDQIVVALKQATDLYRGDFLPNCFADWALAEREHLRGEYATTLEQLIDLLLEERRYEETLSQATMLQRFDPLRESAYRYLMQTHAALGDRAASLRVYHTCASTLQQELGVEPSPATEALRQRLLHLVEEAALPGAPAPVERQRLVGRREEWRQLQEVWRRVQAGEAHCVLLWGEAGIGKTRLAEELIDWVQRQGGTCASSRSYAVQGALTYAPISEWLRSPGIRPALDGIDDLWRVELARLLPELLSDRPELLPPGPMTENWQQQRFFQSIVHALQSIPGPILLHLDDMQWSDAETLTLLQYLIHGARNHPLLLSGGVRTEDAGGNQALAKFVEASHHARQQVELHLGPLSEQETVELARLTLDDEMEPDAAEALFATSEGHPLFLIESVRGGLTAKSPDVEVPTANASDTDGVAAMPPRIYNLLAARLSQLSEMAQQVASTAAVIGRAFDYKILQNAMALDEIALIDALDELWQRRIIRERAGDRYDFSHDRIREVAYQQISRARRHLYHRQVALAMETIYGDNLDDIAAELAAQFEQANDSPNAYHYYRRAAHVALTQHAFLRADGFLASAKLHVPEVLEERISLLEARNTILRYSLQRERWKNNLDELEALVALLPNQDPQLNLDLLLAQCKYYNNTGQYASAVDSAQKAVVKAEIVGEASMLALAYLNLGESFWFQAEMVEAGRAMDLAIDYARQIDDVETEVYALELLAQRGMFTGMPADEIYDLLMRAFECAETTGNLLRKHSLYNKFGYWRVAKGMGDFDRAEEEYDYALTWSREFGNREHEEALLSNLGVLHTRRGDYQKAINAFDAGLEVSQRNGQSSRQLTTMAYRCATMIQMGDLDSVLPDLVSICDRLRDMGHMQRWVAAYCDLGMFHFVANRYSKARTILTQTIQYARSIKERRAEALASCRLGYTLESLGDMALARDHFDCGQSLHDLMGQKYYAMNAKAGLTRIAAIEGDNDAALSHAVIIWETIGGNEMDATIETPRTLRTCYTIFDAHGDTRANAALAMARNQLQYRVSTIGDPRHIEQFWQIDDHDFFRQLR